MDIILADLMENQKTKTNISDLNYRMMSHSKVMKLKLQIAAITFSQYRAFRLMKLTLSAWHKQYAIVTCGVRNVEPPAIISICCYQLGMLIILFLYQLSILQNVRSLPTWHFEKQVMVIGMKGYMIVY